jgi:hypothetical protein
LAWPISTQQIRESQAQVAEAQAKISDITSRIETARARSRQARPTIDIENATLEDVHKHTDLMNANIAELIMGLDDVTAGFSKDFDEMRSKTGMERLHRHLQPAKAESMRQERCARRQHRRQAAGPDREIRRDREAAAGPA